jgi:glutaredoxin 3
MENKILIYGKDGCPYTDQARSAYGNRAVYVNVKKDASGLQEMLKLSGGRRQVPVIVEGENVTVGYGGT